MKDLEEMSVQKPKFIEVTSVLLFKIMGVVWGSSWELFGILFGVFSESGAPRGQLGLQGLICPAFRLPFDVLFLYFSCF